MDDGFVEIDLSQGKKALISSDDYERVLQWVWHYEGRYAACYQNGKKVYLHRFIMKPKKGLVVDHINGDRLDCRRSNLRNCTSSLNASNRHSPVINKHGLRGVYRRSDDKFRAEIFFQGKKYALGTFSTPEEGNAAYNIAKQSLHSGKGLGVVVGRRGSRV